jgi:hypothetical protein
MATPTEGCNDLNRAVWLARKPAKSITDISPKRSLRRGGVARNGAQQSATALRLFSAILRGLPPPILNGLEAMK